jgi:hypothetical protein
MELSGGIPLARAIGQEILRMRNIARVQLFRKCCVALGFVFAVALIAPASASATPITINGTSGTLAAQLTVTTSGSNLIVTLSNTSAGDPAAPSDILTAVFFDIAGGLTLTPVSAVICSTCSVTYGGATDPNKSVGGEWAYANSSNLAYGASYGISSTGLNLFGPGNLFGGTNLSGPVSPDGVQYGITTKTDSTGNNNGGLASQPLINNSVIFTFSGLPSGFDPSLAISNVTFQYGTSLTETHISTPTPTTLPLALVGAVVALAYRRKRLA